MMIYHSKIKEVKNRADIVKVAKYFGLNINRANKCICPFHKEDHASFSISPNKQIYTCFGCGKSGDVITLVQELLNINAYESAKQINNLFCIGVDFGKKISKLEIQKYQAKQKALEEFKKWKNETFQLLCDYLHYLKKKTNLEETYKEIDYIDYCIDIFIYGTEEDKLWFWKHNGRVVDRCKNKMKILEKI